MMYFVGVGEKIILKFTLEYRYAPLNYGDTF
jgi:hypothetical protein